MYKIMVYLYDLQWYILDLFLKCEPHGKESKIKVLHLSFQPLTLFWVVQLRYLKSIVSGLLIKDDRNYWRRCSGSGIRALSTVTVQLATQDLPTPWTYCETTGDIVVRFGMTRVSCLAETWPSGRAVTRRNILFQPQRRPRWSQRFRMATRTLP